MKKLIAVPIALAAFAPAALAASPSVKVSPNPVYGGNALTVSGVTGPRCGQGKQVTIFSGAFADATKSKWHGTPAVYAKVDSHHKFSTKVTISTNVPIGTYKVTARCSTGTLGHTSVQVLQFY